MSEEMRKKCYICRQRKSLDNEGENLEDEVRKGKKKESMKKENVRRGGEENVKRGGRKENTGRSRRKNKSKIKPCIVSN